MRILDTLLLAVVFAATLLALELCSLKEPVLVTTSVAIGPEKDSAKTPPIPASKAKTGYLGLSISGNFISEVYKGSPAAKAGIIAGDKIMDINDKSTFGLTTEQMAAVLTGPIGTCVEIILEHGNEQRKLALIREEAVPVEAKKLKQKQENEAAIAKQESTKQDLTEADVKGAKFCINHHPARFLYGDTVAGGTMVRAQDPDEDNLRYWTMTLDAVALGDLNGDGKGDAVVTVSFSDEVHVVPVINKDGEAIQTGDTIVKDAGFVGEMDIQHGRLTAGVDGLKTSFKLVNEKLVKVANDFQTEKSGPTYSIVELPLSTNQADVLLPELPVRFAEIKSTKEIKTNLHANKLTKTVIQDVLLKERTRLGIDDGSGGYGSLDHIAFGDLNGDGQEDAAVIVGVPGGDNDALNMIPIVLKDGQVTLVGVAYLGAGGYNTFEEKIEIKSGVIHAKVNTVRTKFDPEPATWLSWNFKACNSRLVKCR